MHAWASSVVVAIALSGSACAPAPKVADADAGAASVQRSVVPAPQTPSGAMAKRAPAQPGEKVSPVIAFRGSGDDWTLRIENAGGYAHDVDLTWSNGSQHATGTLRYEGAPGVAADAPILLVGTVDTKTGRRTMRVEITPAACTDAAGEAYTHAVQTTVDGLAPMYGCGDLAK